MSSKFCLALFCTMAALLLVACGTAQPTATAIPPTEPPASPAEPTSEPTAVATETAPARVETTEIAPVTAFPVGAFEANDGDWVFILEADGSWTWSEDGQVEATGTYSIQDKEVTWETDSYCGPATEKSTYTWSYEGGTLLFQVKGRDFCLARRQVVNNVPYEAVSPRPSEGITVTFKGDQCAYHGPESVRAGEIPLILDVRDQSAREKYWVVAYTLDEGKTKEDLRAWKEVGHSPLWVGFHGMLDEQPAGTMQETTIILFEGPLYLACITEPPGYITDVLGPIDVAPAASAP